MTKPERLELRFGKNDADIEAYIKSFGLPKAAIVKKIIREHMENANNGVLAAPVEVLVKVPKDTPAVPTIEEKCEQVEEPTAEVEKPRSPFGGLAVHKK